MSEPNHKKQTDPGLNHAKGAPQNPHGHAAPVQGGAPGPVEPMPEENDAFLHRVAPSRQRLARAFLQGKAPGVMQRYAPDAQASETEGWVEGDDTVHRLAHWREEAIY